MIDTTNHRSPETDYQLRQFSDGWRIESFWYGFDARGERDQFSAWVGDYYATEEDARAALAVFREETK